MNGFFALKSVDHKYDQHHDYSQHHDMWYIYQPICSWCIYTWLINYMKNNILHDHTLIIDELEKGIKIHNCGAILPFLPKGSYLVGGFIRDIILGRETEKLDIDIVVPLNSIEIGK